MEIAADMLEAAHEGVRKTNLMYRANLSYDLLQSYLRMLVGGDLLNKSGEPELFQVSEKGWELLRQFHELKKLEREYKRRLKLINDLLPPNPMKSRVGAVIWRRKS